MNFALEILYIYIYIYIYYLFLVNTTFSSIQQQNVASAVQNTERIPKLINDDLTNPRNQKSDLESSYELFQDDSYSYFDDYNYDYIESKTI